MAKDKLSISFKLMVLSLSILFLSSCSQLSGQTAQVLKQLTQQLTQLTQQATQTENTFVAPVEIVDIKAHNQVSTSYPYTIYYQITAYIAPNSLTEPNTAYNCQLSRYGRVVSNATIIWSITELDTGKTKTASFIIDSVDMELVESGVPVTKIFDVSVTKVGK